MEMCVQDQCDGELRFCEYLTSQPFECDDMGALLSIINDKNCGEYCGENMQFTYSVISKQPTCSEPDLVPVGGEDEFDDYEFGCVCKQGFVMSGNYMCVREDECGCTMEDGEYRQRDSVWRSEDCSKIYTCTGPGENGIVEEDSPCGENTECLDTEEGPACMCEEGFFGNPIMPEGCEEGKKDDDGSKICYTYVNLDGSTEQKCNCTMGYVSSCNDCEDIDECKLGLHECDLSKENCVNIPGGYDCECADGFKETDNGCVDIDECKEQRPCGDNTGCTNKPGSYKCECCAGYKMDDGECVRDTEGFPDIPDDAQCCLQCNIPAICKDVESEPVPICYTKPDGEKQTFEDGKVLFQTLCLNGEEFVPSNAQKGQKCPEEVEPTEPPTPPPTTEAPAATTAGQAPPSSCDVDVLKSTLPPPPPQLSSGPVCGPSNGPDPQTYDSYYEMAQAVCQSSGSPRNMPTLSPIAAEPGPCEEEPEVTEPVVTIPVIPIPAPPLDPEFNPWRPFGDCKFRDAEKGCGPGVKVRTRSVKERTDGQETRDPFPYEIRQEASCFEKCDDPEPQDQCPEEDFCEGNTYDPVCGSIDNGMLETFDNLCELERIACVADKPFNVQYNGKCKEDDEEPAKRMCADGPVPGTVHYHHSSLVETCTGPSVEIFTCGELLCEGGSDTCCKPIAVERKEVDIMCYNTSPEQEFSRTFKHIHYSAQKCQCQENTQDDFGDD
ncbi:latent-transforming growth factor beta-binding protein 4 [Aplysia californica]|uniref:Latent-transforming growth factor beta-binding protein 4 n=1 Tax=Aplysia californica TaxID=6500 RepID=A0ABM1A0E4_APLCA|nr:latent-transforming growth factor beta-binding protein 4 [Aplysia californica]